MNLFLSTKHHCFTWIQCIILIDKGSISIKDLYEKSETVSCFSPFIYLWGLQYRFLRYFFRSSFQLLFNNNSNIIINLFQFEIVNWNWSIPNWNWNWNWYSNWNFNLQMIFMNWFLIVYTIDLHINHPSFNQWSISEEKWPVFCFIICRLKKLKFQSLNKLMESSINQLSPFFLVLFEVLKRKTTRLYWYCNCKPMSWKGTIVNNWI